MKKLKKIRKEYHRLSLLLINKSKNILSINILSNNKSVALNIIYVPHNTEKIRHAYKSKYNLARETQAIILMITDGEKWHYLTVKSLSTLFREITGNNHGDFYCLNCFQSDTTDKYT